MHGEGGFDLKLTPRVDFRGGVEKKLTSLIALPREETNDACLCLACVFLCMCARLCLSLSLCPSVSVSVSVSVSLYVCLQHN